MKRHPKRDVQVQRHQLLPDRRAIVVLDIGCYLVGGLIFQHRELDERIKKLPHVTGCKQHGWVYTEEDETAPTDIFLSVPSGFSGWMWRMSFRYGRVARNIREEVMEIIEELLSSDDRP